MSRSDGFDYKAVFDNTPSLVLVLDPGFVIVAQNRAHALATKSVERVLVGRNLFEAFPENPADSGAAGLSLFARLAAECAQDQAGRHHAALPPRRAGRARTVRVALVDGEQHPDPGR